MLGSRGYLISVAQSTATKSATASPALANIINCTAFTLRRSGFCRSESIAIVPIGMNGTKLSRTKDFHFSEFRAWRRGRSLGIILDGLRSGACWAIGTSIK